MEIPVAFSKTGSAAKATAAGLSGLIAAAAPGAGSPPHWSPLPPLPPAPGETRQAGVAAPFVGVHGGVLLVAGGTNFPDAPPWRGGTKRWWDTVFVLEKPDGPWLTGPQFKLPHPLAHGVSFSTPHGVLCVGGNDAKQTYADVFLLRWDAASRSVGTVSLPPLPEPLALAGGGDLNGRIFVVGGQTAADSPASTTHAYTLDFSGGPSETLQWKRLPDLPGPARSLPVSFAIAGRNDHAGFYVFGGRDQQPGELPKIFSDGYRYDPAARTWKKLNDVPSAFNRMAAATLPTSDGAALVFGGDGGTVFMELAKLASQIEKAEGAQKESLLKSYRAMLDHHRGFSRLISRYDSRRDSWERVAKLPEWPPVVTTATWWNGAVAIPGGEIRPGIRTAGTLYGVFSGEGWSTKGTSESEFPAR